jgi:hypothetical protein
MVAGNHDDSGSVGPEVRVLVEQLCECGETAVGRSIRQVAADDDRIGSAELFDVRLDPRQSPLEDALSRLQVGLLAENDLLVGQCLVRRNIAEVKVGEVKDPGDSRS